MAVNVLMSKSLSHIFIQFVQTVENINSLKYISNYTIHFTSIQAHNFNLLSQFSPSLIMFGRGGGKSHMFKSQASLKSLPSSLKQVSSHSTNKSSKSSQVSSSPQASQVESSHSIKQEQIYFCHTTLLIFPQK